MALKILFVIVGSLSLLGAWAASVTFLWSAGGTGHHTALYALGEKLAVFLLLVNLVFLIFLAWKMFAREEYLFGRALTFLAPVAGSILIASYSFVLGANKPRPTVVTEHPEMVKDREKFQKTE